MGKRELVFKHRIFACISNLTHMNSGAKEVLGGYLPSACEKQENRKFEAIEVRNGGMEDIYLFLGCNYFFPILFFSINFLLFLFNYFYFLPFPSVSFSQNLVIV